MDRNNPPLLAIKAKWVALRKESVDRNVNSRLHSLQVEIVALRKESVDRNYPLETIIVLAK